MAHGCMMAHNLCHLFTNDIIQERTNIIYIDSSEDLTSSMQLQKLLIVNCSFFQHSVIQESFTGNNPCELTCLAHGYSFFYNFGPVTDGTPCKREQNLEEDICVKGHCTVSTLKKNF